MIRILSITAATKSAIVVIGLVERLDLPTALLLPDLTIPVLLRAKADNVLAVINTFYIATLYLYPS